MSENRLQSDIIREFSELYPEKRGQLFHVPNQRNHKLQAFQARSLGIFPGVSDLIYLSYNNIKCIELKIEGSRHKVSHIEQQIEWAKTVEHCGHQWRLCKSVIEAIRFINGAVNNNGMIIKEVEQLIKENGSKKTIRF